MRPRSAAWLPRPIFRESMRKASHFLIIVILCFLVAPGAPGEPLIAHALQLEKAKDSEGAAKLLSAWLDMNPGAPGAAEIFGSYMRTEQNLPALFDASSRFLRSGRGTPGAAIQFERIARLFDLAGRIEEARNAYVAAHDEGAPDSTIVSAFLLSLQMNDIDAMAACIQKMPGKGGSTELFLRALSGVRGGDPSAARAQLIGLAEQTGSPDVALKALWVLYEAARKSGDSAGQAVLRAKLTGRFAAAPEAALLQAPAVAGSAQRALVIQMPAPGPFDAGPAPISTAPQQAAPGQAAPAQAAPVQAPSQAAPQPTQPAPAGAPDVTPAEQPALIASPTLSVQAGSFVMKENADDLVAELTRRGFAPVMIHDSSQGRDRYRVMVGTGLAADAAKGILKKLSDAGFRGFLMQDK